MKQETWILAAIMLVGLAPLFPGWRLASSLFLRSRHKALNVFLIAALTALLAASAFYVPFQLAQGKEVGPLDTLIDLLLFGAFPLGVIGMVAYVLDHIRERRMMVMIACSACFALAILPIAYYFLAEQMHTHFEITSPSRPARSPT